MTEFEAIKKHSQECEQTLKFMNLKTLVLSLSTFLRAMVN